MHKYNNNQACLRMHEVEIVACATRYCTVGTRSLRMHEVGMVACATRYMATGYYHVVTCRVVIQNSSMKHKSNDRKMALAEYRIGDGTASTCQHRLSQFSLPHCVSYMSRQLAESSTIISRGSGRRASTGTFVWRFRNLWRLRTLSQCFTCQDAKAIDGA
jgi:hypothetical protein